MTYTYLQRIAKERSLDNMICLRCCDYVDDRADDESAKKTYRIWFDLDDRHETFITVFADDKYEEILNRIITIRGSWLESEGKIK